MTNYIKRIAIRQQQENTKEYLDAMEIDLSVPIKQEVEMFYCEEIYRRKKK